MSEPTKAVRDVLSQHAKNLAKWGDQPMLSRHAWIGLFAEELGEVARHANELEFGGGTTRNVSGYRAELVDLAAAALGAIRAHDIARDE